MEPELCRYGMKYAWEVLEAFPLCSQEATKDERMTILAFLAWWKHVVDETSPSVSRPLMTIDDGLNLLEFRPWT